MHTTTLLLLHASLLATARLHVPAVLNIDLRPAADARGDQRQLTEAGSGDTCTDTTDAFAQLQRLGVPSDCAGGIQQFATWEMGDATTWCRWQTVGSRPSQ